MMKKKNLLALLLALCLCFALAACGGDSASDNVKDGASDAPTSDNSGTEDENKDDSQDGDSKDDDSSAGESDLAYVQDKGTLIVGITDYEPMDYPGDNGEWIGFDADMAKAFAESLGVDVEFLVLGDWDKKAIELETKAIDVVWNGMTLTNEVKELMSVSEAYCLNKQVVVLPSDKAGDYQTADSLGDLSFAVENGSAGAEELDGLGISYTATRDQASALMEVASGASDACVIDLVMAGAMIGEGTSYPDLVVAVELNSEEYGVGFRQGSDLVDEFNSFWKAAYDDGTVMETAETYGVQAAIIEK